MLLSLVRSNTMGNIGFLRVVNRLIVSISRAKEGLYIIGNGEMMNKNDHWFKVIAALKKDECYGDALPLFCQNHPTTKGFARTADNFLEWPHGGCQRKCETQLKVYSPPTSFVSSLFSLLFLFTLLVSALLSPALTQQMKCGHQCPLSCHSSPHEEIVCKKPCARNRECGHPCKKMCYQDCGPCQEVVSKTLPACQHKHNMSCSADTTTFYCTAR